MNPYIKNIDPEENYPLRKLKRLIYLSRRQLRLCE